MAGRGALRFLLALTGIRVCAQSLLHIAGVQYKRATFGELIARRCPRSRLHTLLVFCILCIPSVHSIVQLSHEPSGVHIANTAIYCMAPVQYICSVLYFATDHFDQFHITDEADAVEPVSVDEILGRPCACSPDVIATIACIGTTAYFISASFLAPEEPLYLKLPMAVLRLHGAFAVMLNTLCLAFVFWKHIKVIDIHVRIFEAQDWSACEDHHVSVLLRNLVRMKESIHSTTELLSYVFSSATILGATALGATVYRYTIESFDFGTYISVAIFIVAQCIFFYVIYRLSEAKDDIEVLVRSADFADSFLSRRAVANAEQRVRETSTTIDWFIITQLLKEEWLEFYVLGMPLHSAAFIKQVVTMVGAALVFLQTRQIT